MLRAIVVSGLALLANSAHSQNLSLGSASGFALLSLEGGSMTINSATKIVGDVGYSDGVVSNTNQKAEDFTGGAYVHSGASFSYEDKNFFPTGGVLTGISVDNLLDQANDDVLLLATNLNGLLATGSTGFLGDNDSLTFFSSGSLNVIDIAGVNYNSDSLTLQSRSGFMDTFVLRVAGNFDFSQSSVILNGLTASNVLFYFPNASDIKINKSATVFNGTILAPNGSVEYHNPATFNGAIIARHIDVHSDFNLNHVPLVPEPSAAILGALGAAMLVLRRKR